MGTVSVKVVHPDVEDSMGILWRGILNTVSESGTRWVVLFTCVYAFISKYAVLLKLLYLYIFILCPQVFLLYLYSGISTLKLPQFQIPYWFHKTIACRIVNVAMLC